MTRKLGAIHYIDNWSQNAAEELAKMGGEYYVRSAFRYR
jgi:hypothetical protein